MTDLRYQSSMYFKTVKQLHKGNAVPNRSTCDAPYSSALLSLSHACAAGANRLKHITSMKTAAEIGLRERSLLTRLKQLQALATSQEVMIPKIHQEAVCIRIRMQ